MNTQEIVDIAEKYLSDLEIAFIRPGELGRVDGELVEVIFVVPDALDPNVVIDPPDVRVWVNIKSKTSKLVEQM